MRRFEGRTAVVTGGSRGIGAATARRLAGEGANVVIAGRAQKALRAVADEIESAGGNKVLPVVADSCVLADLDRLVERTVDVFGGIDVLVNNAGVLPTAQRAVDVPIDEWERTIGVNLTAPWYLAIRCHDELTSGGVVVNVLSSAAFYPSPGLAAYNVTKSALLMATKCLAVEWARGGVRVVGVAPGKVQTAMVEPILDYSVKKGLAVNPLGRVADAHEVASLIAYVASDDASYLTGTIVTLDGGEVAASGADAAR